MAANVPGTSRPSTALCSSSRFTRDPDRAGGDSLGDQLGHALDVVVGGGLVGRAPLAHHERAHRAVRDLRGDVDRARDAVERVEVLGDDSQSHLMASRNDVPGMPSTPSMSPIEPVVAVGGGGREPDAAVAHDHGGDAVPDRRREQRVPGDLAVVVRVHVDEAGRDGEAGGVDLVAARLVDGADRGDAPVVDRDVGDARPAHRGRRSPCRCE